MKNKGSSITWVIILSLFLLSLTFVDFLALHDIHQDYVSTKVLESEQIDVANLLPDWSSTPMEWAYVRISLFLKSVFIVVIIIALVRFAKKLDL